MSQLAKIPARLEKLVTLRLANLSLKIIIELEKQKKQNKTKPYCCVLYKS